LITLTSGTTGAAGVASDCASDAPAFDYPADDIYDDI